MTTITQLQTSFRRQDDEEIIVPNVRPVGIELSPDPKWRGWRLREQRPELRQTYPSMRPHIAPQMAYRAQLLIDKYTREEELKNPMFSPRSLDDLAGYNPTRLRFRLLAETHQRVSKIVRETRPRKPVREEDYDKLPAFWFEEMSSSLFARLWDFAAATFGHVDFSEQLGQRDWTRDMLRYLPADFVRCASVVARGDPYRRPKTGPKGYHDHGYEFLFLSRDDRVYLCTAVIAKLLQEQCFDSLLFGATPQEQTALELLDRTTDGTADGYARKFARYNPIHKYLTDELYAADFWPEVDRVTAGILNLLLPLINMIGSLCPTTPWPPLTEVHQKLHNIVAEAAYLSNGDKFSRSCFWIDFPQPGQLWDLRQEHVTDIPWKASNQAAQAHDNHVLEESDEMQKWNAERYAVFQQANLPDPVDDSQLAVQYELLNPKPRSKIRRAAKVQISLFPFLERYFPFQQNVANGSGGNTGDEVTVIQKAQVVYYAGDDSDEMEQWEDYTLQQHLRAWEDIVNPSTSSRPFTGYLVAFLLSALWWLWLGALALFVLNIILPSSSRITGGLMSDFRVSSVFSSTWSWLPPVSSQNTEPLFTSSVEEVRTTIGIDPVATTPAAEENLEQPTGGIRTTAPLETITHTVKQAEKDTSQEFSSSEATEKDATMKKAGDTEDSESEKTSKARSKETFSSKDTKKDAKKKDNTKTVTRKSTRSMTSTVTSQEEPSTRALRDATETQTDTTTRTETKKRTSTRKLSNTMKRDSSEDEDAAPKEPKTITRKGTRTRAVESEDVTTQDETDQHARSGYTATSHSSTKTTSLASSTSTKTSGFNAWLKKPWDHINDWRKNHDQDSVQDGAEDIVKPEHTVTSERKTSTTILGSSTSTEGSGFSTWLQNPWNRITNWRGNPDSDADDIANEQRVREDEGILSTTDALLASLHRMSDQLARFVFNKMEVSTSLDKNGRDVVLEQNSKGVSGSADLHDLLAYLGSSSSTFHDFFRKYSEKYGDAVLKKATPLIDDLMKMNIERREDAERAVEASAHLLSFWRDYRRHLESADKGKETSRTRIANGVESVPDATADGDHTSVTIAVLSDITVEEYMQDVVDPSETSRGHWTVSEFLGINYNCTINNNGEATCFQTVGMPEATVTR